MNNKSLHEYFTRSYRTGTDIWTHIPTDRDLLKTIISYGKKNGMILDIGCGRGLLAMQLAERGFSVLGIDTQPELIKKNNEEVKNKNLIGKCGFIEGSGLSIPFTDNSFEIIIDSGFTHHLYPFERSLYKKELLRILKQSGLLFSLSFSDKTTMMLGKHPVSGETEFDKYGLHYVFLAKHEIELFYKDEFTLRYHTEETYNSRTDPGESLTYHITVWEKN